MYPMELSLHLAATLMSVGAAVCALYLILLSGRARAWALLSAAFVLFSIERLNELMTHADIWLNPHVHEVVSDALLTGAAACLLGGVYSVRFIFISCNHERQQLTQQLDELQRYHQVAIGRELRMKELYEEKQALKDKLRELTR